MEPICIVAARRTPQGRLLGKLADLTAVELAVIAGNAVLDGIDAGIVDQVILGNVIGAGLGMNIARQVSLGLGVPVEATAYTVNMMCASGMHAVRLAAQAVAVGEARVVLCGGTESMSNAPYLLERARAGYRLGDGALVDSLLRDGLIDGVIGEHMGLTAERLAEQYCVTREEQDAFALRSQQLYAAAHAAGRFGDEIAPVGDCYADEHPRPDTTIEKLAGLAPVFRPDGTVTAGNAAGINDSAALLLVCAQGTAEREGWHVLAVIRGAAAAGCDPALMGLGPVHAIRRLVERLELPLGAFDTIEINEAFAAQALACCRELSLDPDKINSEGGAIALGHPIGASGARLLVHLACRIERDETRLGLATLCVGGGMGAAMALASPDG